MSDLVLRRNAGALDLSPLRLPAAAALFAVALLLWRIGMDGVTGAALLEHAGWCLGLGGEPAGATATLFGHCAACYAAVAAALGGLTLWLWPARRGTI